MKRVKQELKTEDTQGRAPAGHAVVSERLQPALAFLATFAQYLPDMVGFVLTLLYLLFMPIFTSDIVDDTSRFFIICFLHPLVQEGLLTNVRRNEHRRALLLTVVEKAEQYHLAVGELGGPTLFDAIFTTLRRFMIGAVKNPTVGILCVSSLSFVSPLLSSPLLSPPLLSSPLLSSSTHRNCNLPRQLRRLCRPGAGHSAIHDRAARCTHFWCPLGR